MREKIYVIAVIGLVFAIIILIHACQYQLCIESGYGEERCTYEVFCTN